MGKGNQAQALLAGEKPCGAGRWGGGKNRDGNADLELRKLKGTLARKEWFVPMSWDDQGCDRGVCVGGDDTGT